MGISPISPAIMTPVACFASSSVAQRVINAIAEGLEMDAAGITGATKFQDIIPEGDSTKIVEVVQAVEIEFEDELEDEPIDEGVYTQWTVVQDAIDFLSTKSS